MSLWNYIKNAMLNYPEQKIRENQAEMKYCDVLAYAEYFGNQVKNEKCCAIYCKSEMAAALALLGCLAAGVTAVPLSERYGAVHCNKILDMISPSCMITDSDGELQLIHMHDAAYQEPQEHPALIMCTSGTTGKPKGAMLSEDNILTNIRDISDYLKTAADDTILIARPLYHCAVLTGEFLVSLSKGLKICFYSGTFSPARVLGLMREEKVTVFGGTPTLLSLMARLKREDQGSTLKTICISGECMSLAVSRLIHHFFPNVNIYHVYGMTEASPRIAYLPPELFYEYGNCVGLPLASVSIKIMSPNGTRIKKNAEGILWVKGDNVMIGYYNDPEMTSNVIKKGWLCTGDRAVLNEKGYLQILGRADDLIIRAGMNIYPQEIEAAMLASERVKEVLAYGFQDDSGNTQIGMKIVGDFDAVSEVKHLCLMLLPGFQVPTKIEIVDKLPRNGSGKVLRTKNHD